MVEQWYITVAGIVLGLIFMTYGQIKYNKGIFLKKLLLCRDKFKMLISIACSNRLFFI